MNKRIGMQRFDRGRDLERAIWLDIEKPRGAQDKERTEPLAAGEDRITHRLVDAAVETMRLGQDTLEHGVDFARGGRHIVLEADEFPRPQGLSFAGIKIDGTR